MPGSTAATPARWPGSAATSPSTSAASPRPTTLILIASELAANSVVHSASKMFVMRCEIFSAYVWIESQDSGADWKPRQPDDRPHGTDLIELLAAEWGTERSTQGDRITWARVAR